MLNFIDFLLIFNLIFYLIFIWKLWRPPEKLLGASGGLWGPLVASECFWNLWGPLGASAGQGLQVMFCYVKASPMQRSSIGFTLLATNHVLRCRSLAKAKILDRVYTFCQTAATQQRETSFSENGHHATARSKKQKSAKTLFSENGIHAQAGWSYRYHLYEHERPPRSSGLVL